jgi:hypothetical protein
MATIADGCSTVVPDRSTTSVRQRYQLLLVGIHHYVAVLFVRLTLTTRPRAPHVIKQRMTPTALEMLLQSTDAAYTTV